MDNGFGDERREDDLATMAMELEARLDRRTLARTLGVKPAELDMITAGYPPTPEAAERLQVLYRLASITDDLRDPKALLAGLGVVGESEAARLPFALIPRLKTYVIAFLVVDAVVFVGFTIALVLLR